MITIPDLKTSLLDLLHEIKGSEIHPIIGGGFGLYLKIEYVQRLGVRTLLAEWPEPRATNDIDLFLRAEILIESEKAKPLAKAFENLGYRVVSGAEKYQFVKPGPAGAPAGSVKVDILTGPQACFKNTRVRADERRARPQPSVGIHAHPVDEALTLEEGLLSVPLEGRLRSGDPWNSEVFIPHPFTFLMMKLFAFRDRLGDPDKDFGRYHALDLYSILATTLEEEWRSGLEMRDRHGTQPYVLEAAALVSDYFSESDRPGIIRLIGAKILGGSSSEILQLGTEIALTHHEKWNGKGYPKGLSGAAIPIAGRIVALADVFDTITSKRPYKDSFSVEVACDIIKKECGKHFDPELSDAFLNNMDAVLKIKAETRPAEER